VFPTCRAKWVARGRRDVAIKWCHSLRIAKRAGRIGRGWIERESRARGNKGRSAVSKQLCTRSAGHPRSSFHPYRSPSPLSGLDMQLESNRKLRRRYLKQHGEFDRRGVGYVGSSSGDETVSRHNFVERTDTSLAETTLSNIQGQFPNQSYQSSKTPILKPAAKSSGRFLSLLNVSKPLPTSSYG